MCHDKDNVTPLRRYNITMYDMNKCGRIKAVYLICDNVATLFVMK